jgi:protein TonB
MPLFPGGYAAMMRYLSDEYKLSVSSPRGWYIREPYMLPSLVETDGSVSLRSAVLRSVAGGCTEEAVRVVSEMPDWTPGKQRGKPVRVRMNLPVKFTLIN